jgi:hypothetical protein
MDAVSLESCVFGTNKQQGNHESTVLRHLPCLRTPIADLPIPWVRQFRIAYGL